MADALPARLSRIEAEELARVVRGEPARHAVAEGLRATLARRGLVRMGTYARHDGREVCGQWEPTPAGLAADAARRLEACLGTGAALGRDDAGETGASVWDALGEVVARATPEVAGAGGANARSAPDHNHEQGKWP